MLGSPSSVGLVRTFPGRRTDGYLGGFSLPLLSGDLHADMVRRKSSTAGSFDGWVWWELKPLLVPGF